MTFLRIATATVLTFTLVVSSVVVARAHGDGFVHDECILEGSSGGVSTPAYWRRSDAKSYAYTGRYEGYSWGGGCWNNNNVDDSPGEPVQVFNHGEGGDCSGFTFKSWGMHTSYGSTAYREWDILKEQHGPYTASAFRTGAGGAASVIGTQPSYAQTMYMDAFASTTHIGMIYAEGTSNNQDQIIEALNEASGTVLRTTTYRGSGSYTAVRRAVWVADCYPHLCQ